MKKKRNTSSIVPLPPIYDQVAVCSFCQVLDVGSSPCNLLATQQDESNQPSPMSESTPTPTAVYIKNLVASIMEHTKELRSQMISAESEIEAFLQGPTITMSDTISLLHKYSTMQRTVNSAILSSAKQFIDANPIPETVSVDMVTGTVDHVYQSTTRGTKNNSRGARRANSAVVKVPGHTEA